MLALAGAVGSVGLLLKQPLSVAFIATGIIAGPDALGIVESAEHVALLAQIGIALLLFLVGQAGRLHFGRWIRHLHRPGVECSDKRGVDSLHGRIAIGFSSSRTSPSSRR